MEEVKAEPFKWSFNEQGITTLFYRHPETGSLGFDIIKQRTNDKGTFEHKHTQRIDDTNEWIAEYPLIVQSTTCFDSNQIAVQNLITKAPADTIDLGRIRFLKFVNHSREVGRKGLFGLPENMATSNIFFLGKVESETRLFSLKMNAWKEEVPKLYIFEEALDHRVRYDNLVHAFFMVNSAIKGALIMQYQDKIQSQIYGADDSVETITSSMTKLHPVNCYSETLYFGENIENGSQICQLQLGQGKLSESKEVILALEGCQLLAIESDTFDLKVDDRMAAK